MEIIKRNTDYALRALLSLAELKDNEIKSIKEISAECNLPEDFLRKILQKLAKEDIVKSSRGNVGGFSLNKKPEDISLIKVIEVIQGKFAINKCFLGSNQCTESKTCKIKPKLINIQSDMLAYLERITLDMLID